MRPFVSITLRRQAWFWRSPPSGPRGRREKLIWSLAQECKSLPAKRLDIKLDQGAHRLGMPYPPRGLSRRRVTGSPVHKRGVTEPSRRLACARHKLLVSRNLHLAWGSHRARQGLRPWYPPECIQAPRHVLQRCALLAQGDCLGDQDATLCRDWATIAKVVEQAHGP